MASEPSTSGADFTSSCNLTRRAALISLLCALATRRAVAAASDKDDFARELLAIQTRLAGRVGVHVHDTKTLLGFGTNSDERFAMCSTFKLPLAAAVLARADAGKLDLDQRIEYGPADMLQHAPVTSAKLSEGGMTVRELCAASVEVSDNPAANLLLPLIGGPAGLTQFVRGLGDDKTRLDRTEPQLNTNLPGDPRDTTTPRSMAQTVGTLLTGKVLSESSRTQLIAWLVNSTTGARRVRAGLPARWKVGDKTGTGSNGAVNDVVIAWPPNRAPLIAAVYMSDSRSPFGEIEAAHAQVGRLIAGLVDHGGADKM